MPVSPRCPLVAGPPGVEQWLRASAPAGPVIALSSDLLDLVGPLRRGGPCSACGLVAAGLRTRPFGMTGGSTGSTDVVHAEPVMSPGRRRRHRGRRPEQRPPCGPAPLSAAGGSAHDRRRRDLAGPVRDRLPGAHHGGPRRPRAAGPRHRDPAGRAHGAAGVCRAPRAASPRPAGRARRAAAHMSDVVWYPNQIDGRNNIADARRLGARIVATYLDLIAYDIPRYHGSEQAWHAYRSLQRRIALSMDGITAISADVAQAPAHGGSPPRARSSSLTLPLGARSHHPRAGRRAAGRGSCRTREVPGHEALRRGFWAMTSSTRTATSRSRCGNGHCRRANRATSCSRACTSGAVARRRTRTTSIARHLDLRGRIHTVGPRHPPRVVPGCSPTPMSCSIPSSSEGFGLVPYEAAALGTPTVFTDFGPLREISGAHTAARHMVARAARR